MKKFNGLVMAAALAGAPFAQADVLGGGLEVMYWNGSTSGDTKSGGFEVDVEDDLGFDDDGFVEVSATLEHPVPLIPNIRVKYNDMDTSENGVVPVEFNGIPFNGADVRTDLDLTHYDLILYYELLDNIVSLDVGLDVKLFDGELNIVDRTDPTNRSDTDIDEPLPMGYVSTEVGLPFLDFSLGAELSGIAYSGNHFYDGRVRLRNEFFGVAVFEVGYRQMGLTVDDIDDVDFDVKIGGAYVSTGIDF